MNVEFNTLPQVVRERLVRVCGPAAPADPAAPVLASRTFHGKGANIALGVMSAAGFVALTYVALSNPTNTDSAPVILGAAGLFGLTAFLVGVLLVRKVPPMPGGAFMFRTCFVRVEGTKLAILPLGDAGRPTIVHRTRNGVYQGSTMHVPMTSGGSLAFGFRSIAAAEAGFTDFASTVAAFQRASAAGNTAALRTADPFAECIQSGNWNDAESPQRPPLAEKTPAAKFLVALAVGVALAVAFSGGTGACVQSPCKRSEARRMKFYEDEVRTKKNPGPPPHAMSCKFLFF